MFADRSDALTVKFRSGTDFEISDIETFHACTTENVMGIDAALFETFGSRILSSRHNVCFIAVAKAENIADTGKMLDPALEIISSMPPEVKTSMLQDIQAKRKTEVDAFSGTLCAKARLHGINAPRNQEVYNIIRKKEKQSDSI